MYNIEVQFSNPKTIPIRSMSQGQIAVISEGSVELRHMLGEIVVCNVMGWFTLSTNRYWPSEYASKGAYSYVPDFRVRVLAPGDVLTVKAQ